MLHHPTNFPLSSQTDISKFFLFPCAYIQLLKPFIFWESCTVSLGIISSFQILIKRPFPTCHPTFSGTTEAEALQSFHILVLVATHISSSNLRILFLWKYFVRKACFHHSLEYDNSLQTNLAPRFKFMNSGSLIANPPHSFRSLTMFQFFLWDCFSLYFPPFHINFLSIMLIL